MEGTLMDLNQDKLRKQFTPDQKFSIIKEQLTTKTSVTEICKKYDINPSQFYKWLDKFLAGARDNLKRSTHDGPTKSELRKIDELEKKNVKMQSVISEIIHENIELKKNLGLRGLL
jgi:transposase